MIPYQIVYSPTFEETLEAQIIYWQELNIGSQTIQKQVQLIKSSINLIQYYPEMYSDVSDIYGFDKPTRRILIGNTYALFYRVYPEQQLILIGSFFSQQQMKIKF